MTRFEEIIGNTRMFEIVLDNFFKGWPGSHDVMPAEDTDLRLFRKYENFADFCKMVRSTEVGKRSCMQCDAEHASESAQRREPMSYICHAGLLDIAVQIIVDGKLLATIF
jgi:ligand-binding sensor protein